MLKRIQPIIYRIFRLHRYKITQPCTLFILAPQLSLSERKFWTHFGTTREEKAEAKADSQTGGRGGGEMRRRARDPLQR